MFEMSRLTWPWSRYSYSRRLVADESRHLHLSKRRSDILLFFPSYICFRHVKRIPHGSSIRSIVQIKQIVFEQVFVTFVTSQKRALTVALVFVTSRSFRLSSRVVRRECRRASGAVRSGRAPRPEWRVAAGRHSSAARTRRELQRVQTCGQRTQSNVHRPITILHFCKAFCNCNFLLFWY